MKRLSYPISVQIELTEACNQKCVHCYNYWRYDSHVIRKDEMSVDNFLNIIDKLNDCGVSLLTLTGGEPLLRPEIFFSLLKRAKKYDMEIGLNSNAVLIDKVMAKKMSTEGLDHILVSFLGNEKTHNLISNSLNGFNKTCKGITNLIEAEINVTVNMVASKLNQSEIFHVGNVLNGLGVQNFCVTPMVPSHKSHLPYLLSGEECKNALLALLETKKVFGFNVDTLEPIARCLFNESEEDKFIHFYGNRICSAAVSSCAVSSKGNVRPCIHSDKNFGNILSTDLSIIWEDMSFWSSSEILPEACVGCNANIICEGGCRMSAKLVNGEYNGKDMYMTDPIMDPERIKKLPQRSIVNLTDDTSLKVNEHLRFRKEEFGWVVYVYSNLEFCTDSGYNFIKKLCGKERFLVKDIKNEFNLSDDLARLMITKLINSKIILIVN